MQEERDASAGLLQEQMGPGEGRAGATTECRWCCGSGSNKAWLRLQHHQPGSGVSHGQGCAWRSTASDLQHRQTAADWGPSLLTQAFPAAPLTSNTWGLWATVAKRGPGEKRVFQELEQTVRQLSIPPTVSWCLSKKLPGK